MSLKHILQLNWKLNEFLVLELDWDLILQKRPWVELGVLIVTLNGLVIEHLA